MENRLEFLTFELYFVLDLTELTTDFPIKFLIDNRYFFVNRISTNARSIII